MHIDTPKPLSHEHYSHIAGDMLYLRDLVAENQVIQVCDIARYDAQLRLDQVAWECLAPLRREDKEQELYVGMLLYDRQIKKSMAMILL